MRTTINDMNQAIVLLDRYKHWTVKCINRQGRHVGYGCTIWGDGKRVSAQAKCPVMAVNRALEKLRGKTVPVDSPKFGVVG